MYPYLSDFLTLTSRATGHCVQIFDGCRTQANAIAGVGKASGDWVPEYSGTWDGCCCWTFQAETYDPDINPDPWFDPLNPATAEVAGALVDPPSSEGTGFYLEPSISPRFFEEDGFGPLEMYATFTVVSATARGERAWIDWLQQTLMSECDRCDGHTAEIRLECPCPPDDFDGVIDADGCLIPPTAPDAQAPPEPVDKCDSTGPLEPWQGDPPAVQDYGVRQLLQVRFKGLEQLTDGDLWECAGNRYKILFDVENHEWFGDPILQCTLGGTWDRCSCLCEPAELCSPVDLPDDCGPEHFESAETFETFPPVTRVGSLDTVGGRIAMQGRYVRPEKFLLDACLTTPQPASVTNRLKIVVRNGGQEIRNAKIIVWEALEGTARPDTQSGWATYRTFEPVFEMPIIRLRPFETVTRNADCSVEVVCNNGTSVSGTGIVEPDVSGCCGPVLTCGRRFWVALQLPCVDEWAGNYDLSADVFTVLAGAP